MILTSKNPHIVTCTSREFTIKYILNHIFDGGLIKFIDDNNLPVGTDLNKWQTQEKLEEVVNQEFTD